MKRQGFSLLELLLASAILVVLGVLVTRALLDQADLARRTQARNEVQDRVRMVMELVKQDLMMAGSSRYVSFSAGSANSFIAGVTEAISGWQGCSSTNPCLSADAGNSTSLRDRFSVRYITSLRPTSEACRKVEYSFDSYTLRRSDVGCSQSASPQPLADNILVLNLRFECSDGSFADTGSPPCTGNRYARAAYITVVGFSLTPAPGNPPDASSFSVVSGNSTLTENCPLGRICFGTSERVELPSLKDQ
ncbi:prepilin-type N-terminal cleavage/methylation domain-containing protein [Thermus tengchongensis]|uniref:prepilin-type N-terminal cleavage/methylation domain-containing protein n=1 Tax=Thermus tengchongensis TaxID=1214928 RepID=UPI001F28A332|nr:prepilin-type N-terminal cleavage/methylation domain-containing protein [Thermus tengchongensis]